ncbi:hypothetical protein ACFSTC_37980 [Nonomuraea ferruginea]
MISFREEAVHLPENNRLRQVQGPPRRPARDRHRHGRHPRRHPGPHLVLARQHHRHHTDPPGQGRHARLDPVQDRVGRGPGFASADNRRYLRQGDHYYIIGERLRSGSAEAALSRQGRYQDVADNLEVNEVRIGEADQFVICFNTHGAMRHAAIRERLLAQLQELIAGTDTPTATKRAELRGVISTKPGLNCYLRTTPKGLLRIDAAKVKAETNLDGKYLLCCSDPKLLGRGHRPRLQATARGRAGLARHEAGHRPTPGLSPAPRGGASAPSSTRSQSPPSPARPAPSASAPS